MLLNLLQQYVSRVIIESRGSRGRHLAHVRVRAGRHHALYFLGAQGRPPAFDCRRRPVDPIRVRRPDAGRASSALPVALLPALAAVGRAADVVPAIHWIILSLLASSIIINFLIESDSSSLQFLNSFRLRVLFTIIIGVMSAVATLCADLNDPFRGNFQITPSADQLYVIRDTLAEEQCASLPLEERPASDSAIERRAEQAGYTGKGCDVRRDRRSTRSNSLAST